MRAEFVRCPVQCNQVCCHVGVASCVCRVFVLSEYRESWASLMDDFCFFGFGLRPSSISFFFRFTTRCLLVWPRSWRIDMMGCFTWVVGNFASSGAMVAGAQQCAHLSAPLVGALVLGCPGSPNPIQSPPPKKTICISDLCYMQP